MKFQFAKDKWKSQEFSFAGSGVLSYDKFQHFLGGIVVALLAAIICKSAVIGSLISGLFWFFWEIKDGLLSWKAGYITRWPIEYNWGGDGFSWRDMLAAWTGAALFLFIFIVFNK